MTEDIQRANKKKLLTDKISNYQKNAFKLVSQITKMQKSKKVQENKLRNLAELNSFLQDIQKISPSQNQIFADPTLIVFVRHFLTQNYNKIHPLNFFKLILVSETVADRFIAHSIPLYVARAIQRDDISRLRPSVNSNYEEQVFEALRFMKHWIERYPRKFPQYLAFCLVAFAELPVATSLEQRKKDQIPQHVKTFAIDILLIMAVKNTKLCCICGGFSLLVNSITDPIMQQKSYDIISKMLIFLNDTKNRQLTAPYIDFKKVFHVLTDLDNVFLEESYKARNHLQMLSKFQAKLGLAKNAIVTLLKSWVGLIYIGNQPSAISSLLETLKQIPKKYDSYLRNIIFETLEQIISVGDSIMTASTAEQKHSFKISNLIGCYLMTVIELLIENNLLRILIQLSGVEELFVSEPAQKLLKRLTLLIFNYRPESSKYIDFLITAANKSNSNSNKVLKSSSSFVINKIGNYIYDRKQKKNHPMFNELENLFSLKSIFIPHSRASLNSISKALNFISYKEKKDYRKDLLEKDPIPKQHKENYPKWNWNIIQNLLEFPDPEKFNPSTNQRYRENKMYKYLLRFFSPSRGNFYKLDWSTGNFTYIKVGMLLVKNSITIPENLPLIRNPPQSQFQCTVSFIGDLEKLLQINIKQCLKDNVQWNVVLCTKLQRELLSFIGLFSETKNGYESLICENRFLELLNSCMSHQECSHLVYLILINFDFYREDIKKLTFKNPNGAISFERMAANSKIPPERAQFVIQQEILGAKQLLKTCLLKGSYSLRLACVEIIKILLKTEVPQFTKFSYRLLIEILHLQQKGEEIVQIVVEFLEENLTNKNSIEMFLQILASMIYDFDQKYQIPKNKSQSSSSSPDLPQNQVQQKQEQNVQKNISFFSQNTKIGANAETKIIKFDDIKSKLTNPIIIRLLSYDSGIQLAEKHFPDWLDQEFQRWTSPDHSYCTVLQNKLNGALNFVKKKQKGFYKITSNSHVYDLLFIYKLPWILHVNDQKFPLWIRQRGQSYQFYVNFGAEGEQGARPHLVIDNDNLKIMLGIGTMLVDQEFNVVDTSESNSPLTIFLTMKAKDVDLFGQKMLMVESNGVEVYYKKFSHKKNQMSEQEDYGSFNKLSIYRIVINVKLPTVEHAEELPLHLINELIKTKRGRNFIESKKYVEYAFRVLNNYINKISPIPSLLEVRSTLWFLGFYGSRNEGIRILNEKKILEKIITMTYNSPTLSLRGTCRYILNMFSHSEYGRNLLIQNGFLVNSRCLTCYPKDLKSFYSITWPSDSKKHFILDESYWQTYNSLQKPMTKNEEKLFELISLLINSLSFKSAVNQIREILKGSPKVANSINLLQNIINLMTFFKYKHESRKSILNIFDQIIKSPDFNSQTGGKITFFLHEQSPTFRKLSIDLPKSEVNLDRFAISEIHEQNSKTEELIKN